MASRRRKKKKKGVECCTERVRLEWTQDAGGAQGTDKLTYNRLPQRNRAHEGGNRATDCTHRDKGGWKGQI